MQTDIPIRIVLLVTVAQAATSTCLAQPILRTLTMGNSAGELTLLNRPEIRDELDLVADQLEQLQSLRSKFRRQMRERFTELRNSGAENARARAKEIATALNQELQTDLTRILLPHQLRRLQQIRLQRRLSQLGPATILTEEVAKQLGITDDQQQQLRDEQQVLDIEYRRQLTELRAKIRQRFVELLTPEQRQKLQELIGTPFQFGDDPTRGQLQLQLR